MSFSPNLQQTPLYASLSSDFVSFYVEKIDAIKRELPHILTTSSSVFIFYIPPVTRITCFSLKHPLHSCNGSHFPCTNSGILVQQLATISSPASSTFIFSSPNKEKQKKKKPSLNRHITPGYHPISHAPNRKTP